MRQFSTDGAACRAADLGGGQGADAITAEEALKAEDARYSAQISLDFAAMERLFGDDLVYIHSGGVVDDKSSFIEAQRSKAVVYRHMKRSDVKVRVYGPVAIITGKAQFEVSVKGEDRSANLMFHSIWVKRGSTVQFVSWHAAAAPAGT